MWEFLRVGLHVGRVGVIHSLLRGRGERGRREAAATKLFNRSEAVPARENAALRRLRLQSHVPAFPQTATSARPLPTHLVQTTTQPW